MNWRFLTVLVIAFCGQACSVVSGKTKLERYLDGENPDVQKVIIGADNEAIKDSKQFTSNPKNNGADKQYKAVLASHSVSDNAQAVNTVAAIAESGIDETPELALEPAELRCLASDNVSFSYRKRVAVLPMTLVQRQDAVDIPYVEREMSQALSSHLSGQERLTPFDASSYHDLQPYSSRSRLSKPLDPDLVRATAQDLNAQFVVAGKLLDLSFEKTNAHSIDLVTSLRGWKTLARETYQRATDSYWRRFNMELSLYDGPSGALIKRERYSGEANHPVNVERHQGLESHAFWQSDYGQLVDKTLNDQAMMISRALECLPMRAQVSRVDFDVVEINAGLDANLMPGDRLRIFHREPAGRDPQGVPKHRWKYYGGLTIKGVFPLKSIAVLDDGLAPDVIDLGDIVQAW